MSIRPIVKPEGFSFWISATPCSPNWCFQNFQAFAKFVFLKKECISKHMMSVYSRVHRLLSQNTWILENNVVDRSIKLLAPTKQSRQSLKGWREQFFFWFAFTKRANLQQWTNMSAFFQSANTQANRVCLSLDLPFTIMLTRTNLAIFLLTARYANKQMWTFSWKMEKAECGMSPFGCHFLFFGVGHLAYRPDYMLHNIQRTPVLDSIVLGYWKTTEIHYLASVSWTGWAWTWFKLKLSQKEAVQGTCAHWGHAEWLWHPMAQFPL